MFETPGFNIKKLHFAKLDALTSGITFFGQGKKISENKADFSTIWEQAIRARHQSLEEIVLFGAYALFKSYFDPWYSKFTRHNQTEVTQILDFIMGSPSLEKLLDYLINRRAIAINKNPQGHYCRMLDFSINQIQELKKTASLSDIDVYLRDKSGFHKWLV